MAQQILVWGYTEEEAKVHRDEAVHCLKVHPNQVVMLVGNQDDKKLRSLAGRIRPFGYIPQYMRCHLRIPRDYYSSGMRF